MVTSRIAAQDRVGRLGVMYVRSILAQAGVGNEETTTGEDYYAVDLTVNLPSAKVSVQVKAGTKPPNRDGSFSVGTKTDWRKIWAETVMPVYLVYVHLEKRPPPDWVEHSAVCTTIHARAHWMRVNSLSAPTAKVPAANRLTVATFAEWEQDVSTMFGKAVTG